MRTHTTIPGTTRNWINSLPAILLMLFFLLPGLLPAQDDSTAAVADTSAAPAAEEAEAPEMISPGITFTAVQNGGNQYTLKALLKAKVDGQFYNLYGMRIRFYAVGADAETELGSVITDGSGKALFTVKNDSLPLNAEGKLQFKAVFAGNKSMDAAEEVVSFQKANLSITAAKEEEAMNVQVKLTDAEGNPVKDVAVGIYVQRSFLPLKVGEGTTDENGEALVEFPKGIPGDAKGNLTILGKIDENENFGYLETAVVQPWGLAVSNKSQEQPRALWSSHPPVWMLITFIVLMVAVWGHYLVIVYELFRLRKEEPSIQP